MLDPNLGLHGPNSGCSGTLRLAPAKQGFLQHSSMAHCPGEGKNISIPLDCPTASFNPRLDMGQACRLAYSILGLGLASEYKTCIPMI